jgi:cell division protein FtsI/penicillin-binding protein 2
MFAVALFCPEADEQSADTIAAVLRTLLVVITAGLLAGVCAAQDLQAEVDRAMAGRSGSAVIADVSTGKVLAAYNLKGAARRVAPPGSAIKPFVLRALIDNHVVEHNKPLMCNRKLRVGSHDLACGHPQLPAFDPASAVAYSCNTYFAEMGAQLKPEALRDSLLSSGVTGRFGASSEEIAGNVILSRSREELQLQSLGETNAFVTPLNLLNAYRRLAMQRKSADGKYSPVYSGLDGAVRFGMSRLASSPDIPISGKTGTARAIEGHWTHAWFAGFAPSDEPRVAVVVFLERGTGPADAAPIARKLFEAYMRSSAK